MPEMVRNFVKFAVVRKMRDKKVAAKPEVVVVTWPYEMKAMKKFYTVLKYEDPRTRIDDVIRVLRNRVRPH